MADEFNPKLPTIPDEEITGQLRNPITFGVMEEAFRQARAGTLAPGPPLGEVAVRAMNGDPFFVPGTFSPERHVPALRNAPEEFGSKIFGEEAGFLTNLGGFGTSVASALGPELFGLSPLDVAEEFRATNPTAGTVSELAGSILGFAAIAPLPGTLLARSLPAFGRAMQSTKAIEAAFARGAAREAMRFAPFEALRIGGASLDPESDVGEQIKNSIIDLGLFATVGGGISRIAASRPFRGAGLQGEQRVSRLFPDDGAGGGFDLNATTQEKIKFLQTAVNSDDVVRRLDQDDLSLVNGLIDKLKRVVLTEAPPKGVGPVGKLTGGAKQSDVNKLFHFRSGKNTKFNVMAPVRKINKSDKTPGVANENLFNDLSSRFGLPPGSEAHIQFPRFVVAKSDTGSRQVRSILERNFISFNSNKHFIRPEADGGFVMAVRLKGRTVPGKGFKNFGSKGDQFAVFKTDQPGLFVPEEFSRFNAVQAKQAFKVRDASRLSREERALPIARMVDETKQSLTPPKFTPELAPEPGGLRRSLLEAPAGSVRREILEAGDAAGTLVKKLLAPVTTAFTNFPRAQRMVETLRRSHAKAHARAVTIFNGDRIIPQQSNLMLEVIEPAKRFGEQTPRFGEAFIARLGIHVPPNLRGGIKPLIEALDDNTDDLLEVSLAHTLGMSVDDVVREGFSPRVVRLWRKLSPVDDQLTREVSKTAMATGDEAFVALPNHNMISRMWRGNLRSPVWRKGADHTKPIAYASGKTRPEVQADAKRITEALKKEGFDVVSDVRGRTFTTGGADTDMKLVAQTMRIDDPAATRLRQNMAEQLRLRRGARPTRFQERKGVRGFAGEFRPLTKQELEENIFRNILDSNRYMTDRWTRSKLLTEDLANLRADAPGVAAEIDRIATILAGGEGAVTRQLNRIVNNATSGVLGGNSATKITRTLNQAMFQLTLGAFDMGFPILNALTFAQTVLPESSFVLTAGLKDLRPYYGVALVPSAKGGVRHVRYLDPLRISLQVFKDIRRADRSFKQYFKQLTREGTIAPRFTEEFLGESKALLRLRDLSGPGDFATWLNEASKFFPSASEELARLHAAAVGRRLAMDFVGLSKPEQIAAFGAKFVERTMFNYSVADRPKIITGPIGGLFGLFKNWMMNYLWNFGTYADQGFRRGNFAPMLWAMAGTSSVGGITAAPGFFIADGFSKMLSDKGVAENLFEAFGGEDDPPAALDALLYGFPAFAGVSLTARAAAPGSDPIRDVNQLFSIATFDRLKAAGQFLGNAPDVFVKTGQSPGESRDTFDQFAKAFLPRTLNRALVQTSTGAIRSLNTGNQITDQLGIAERLAFGFGIPSTDIVKEFDASREIWSSITKRRELTSTLGQEYGEAIEADDTRLMDQLIKRAVTLGLDPTAVVRSGQANYEARVVPASDRLFEKQVQAREGLRIMLERDPDRFLRTE